MARAALRWTLQDLADAARVHRNTINNVEHGRYLGSDQTLMAIREAFEGAGVEFIDEDGGGPGVRLRQP